MGVRRDGQDMVGKIRIRRSGDARLSSLREVDPRQLALLLEGLTVQARPKPTFGELAHQWWATHSKRLVAPDNERRHIRALGELHGLAEEDLLPRIVEHVLSSLLRENGGRLSRSTVNKIRGTGRQVINAAIADRVWREANPFALARRLRQPKPTTWNTLSLDEARALLGVLRRDLWREVATSLLVGLRPGELKALRKEDLDWERGTIHVRRSNARDSTKTGRNRLIPIPAQLHPVLEEAMRVSTSELLFPNRDGRLQRFDAKKSRILRTALARAGVSRPGFRWLDLRHTCATLHREAGCDPLVVKLALGHSTNNPTDAWYSHLSLGYQRSELEKLRLIDPGESPGGKELDGVKSMVQVAPKGAEMAQSIPTPDPAVVAQAGRAQASQERGDQDKSTNEVLTAKEAADYLKVGRATFKKIRPSLPCGWVGGRARFLREDLDAFLRSGGTRQPAEGSNA